MAEPRQPRKKKAAAGAAAEPRRPLSAGELRRQAEQRLAALSAQAAALPAPEELTAAVHELRVHQIELEMQNEELLRAQLEADALRAKYAELFHLAPVGYFTLSEEGIVGEANVTAAGLLGVERRQLAGQPFSAFVFAADRDGYYRLLRLLKQAEEPQSCEVRLQCVGGEPFWAQLEGRPRGAGGERPGYHLTFTDVDERVLAEEALRRREEQLASAVDGSGVGLWDWYPQTGEETFSERWAEILGFTLAELAPTSIETWRRLSHPDDLRRADVLLEEHFSGQSAIYACEARMRHKDGHWVWVLDRGKVSEWAADGRPLRMIGTQLDISERKLAEEALREASLYARNLIETSLDPLVTISAEGRITDVNAATEKVTGRDRAYLIGSDFADYFTEPVMARAGYLQAFSTGHVIDYPLAIRHTSGALTEVLYNASVYRDERGGVLGVFAAARDVTARLASEAALRESEEKFRTVADFTYDWETWRGPDGRYRYVSPSCERISGHAAAEFIADPSLLVQITHPDDLEEVLAHTDATASESQDQDRELEFRILTPSGETRWVGHSCTAVYGDDGQWLGRRASNRDITARKLADEERKQAEAEIRRLNAELEERVIARTAQLEAANRELEAFVYSASHDLRAPLRAIDGFSQMVLDDAGVKLGDDDREHLARVRAAAQRMALLIDGLLVLSRASRGDMALEDVDVSALATEVTEELREVEPERRVEVIIAPGMRAVADPALLRAVLVNLLSNALKFSAVRKTAHVEVGEFARDGERVFFVRDDGAGFDMDFAAHLFGAFQRMHPPGEFAGDGIGLATVQRLVSRHGGRVWAESEVDKGATFSFTLPETVSGI